MSKQEESLQQIQTMRENLRILRQSRGWDLEELSARSLIPYATLEAIEQGGEFNMSCLAPLLKWKSLFDLAALISVNKEPCFWFFPKLIGQGIKG